MTAAKGIRIALGEVEFTALVNGQVVRVAKPGQDQPVEIILSDIGFGRMQKAIMDAVRNAEDR